MNKADYYFIDKHDTAKIRMAIKMLHARLDELEPNGSAREKARQAKLAEQFQAMQEAWQSKLCNAKQGKYYVYAHCDSTLSLNPRKHPKDAFAGYLGLSKRPFYIGKGTGNRSSCLERNSTYGLQLQKLSSKGLKPEIQHIAENIDEASAFELESLLILSFVPNAIDANGYLTNAQLSLFNNEQAKAFILKAHPKFYKLLGGASPLGSTTWGR